MNNVYQYIILIVLLFGIKMSANAQSIESIISAPILSMTGGVSVNNISTFTYNDSLITNPFALYLTGNLNFSFFNVLNLPLSFAYTNQKFSKDISLPINRFSLSPSYKWVKLYAGYASMTFSPYSLSGHEFFGGGVELSPNNGLKVSAMFGRLKKSSSGEDNETEPSYRRLGGGFKVEYQHKKIGAGVNIFKAQDIISSAHFPNPDSIPILPQDNLTGGVNFNISAIKNIVLIGEYGFSALNRNIYKGGDKFRLLNTDGDLSLYHAAKAQITFTHKIGNIGATYEYVVPNYTTLGTYYMTNDFENITANFSTSIKKFNVAANIGYQRNDLNKQKNSRTARLIYSGNFSGSIAEKFSFVLTFSNLHSYLYINDVYSQVTQTNPFQNLDTLNVTQLSFNSSLNADYSLQNTKDQRQNISMNLTYQRSSENQQYSRFSGNDIINTMLGYQFSLAPTQLSVSSSIIYNYNKMPEQKFTQAITLSLSVQKSFVKVLRSALSFGYSNMSSQDGHLSDVLNIRLTGGYTLVKKHNFNLATTILYTKNNAKNEVKKRTQYVINLSYSYSFGAEVGRKGKKLTFKGNF